MSAFGARHPRARRTEVTSSSSKAAETTKELTFSNGKYVGQVKDGKPHGEGTLSWASGDKYVGQWKDGMQHGLGKATLADGEVGHDGEWENGEAKE